MLTMSILAVATTVRRKGNDNHTVGGTPQCQSNKSQGFPWIEGLHQNKIKVYDYTPHFKLLKKNKHSPSEASICNFSVFSCKRNQQWKLQIIIVGCPRFWEQILRNSLSYDKLLYIQVIDQHLMHQMVRLAAPDPGSKFCKQVPAFTCHRPTSEALNYMAGCPGSWKQILQNSLSW
jgi:hypothetical protein